MNDLPKYEYRARCLKAKGEECIVCDASEDIVVHHVDGDRSNNDLDNLIPVCNGCHSDIHAGSRRVAEWVKKLGKQPKSDSRTTVQVEDETWRALNQLRDPGQTFDDVLREQLQLEAQADD